MTNESPRSGPLSGIGQFWAEVKRRHVARFSIGYAAAAFVALQLAEIVFPAFGIGEGALRLLVAVLALGFLPAVVIAWLYDVTAQGIRRTQENPSSDPEPRRLSVIAFALITIGITGGVTWYVLDQDVLRSLATGRTTFDPTDPIRSLAVLPLEDFSAGGDQAYFAAGMHEELIARLSMLEGVRVVSRTTVMRYAGTTLTVPEIGRELGVDVLLEGSVNRSGDRVRITLQVIHAPSDSHITTLQFDREAGDVLALQSEVAHAVMHEIQGAHEEARFTLAVAGISPEAQEAYFRGKHEYERGTTEGYRTALEYFEDALALDSAFAPAMAGLAGTRFLLGMEDPITGAGQLQQARAEALSALALDTTSLEVREVVDLIDRSLPSVLALASTPPTADGLDTTLIVATTGLGQRIEQQVRLKAMSQSESSPGRMAFEARRLMAGGRHAEAAAIIESLVRQSPEASPAWELLGKSYIGSGNPTAAAEAMRRWQRSGAPGAPNAESVGRLAGAVAELGATGYWTWRLEELEAAEAAGRDVSATELAAAHAALGHAEEAIALLAEAVEDGDRGLSTLRSDPVWDELRGNGRFREIERQAQLTRPPLPPNSRPRRGGPDGS